MYAWPLDPSFDWSRYACPKCGQILTTIVQVGFRFPVMRPDPHYLAHRPEGEQALPFRDEPARSPQSPPESVVPEARAPELRGSAGTASGGHIQEPRQERNRDGDQSEPWGHPLGGGDSRREGLSLARRR